MPRNESVLLVTDQTRERHGLALASALGISAMLVDEMVTETMADYPNLVFDVNLQSLDIVRQLKDLLAGRRAGCRIFLVDPDVRVTSVHANVLGAHAMLPFSGTARDIQDALQRHFAQKRSETRQSIDDGMATLDTTFRSLTGGTILDTESVLQAGSRIADAILDEGTEGWLETVKDYHMGTFQHCMLVTGVAGGFGASTGMSRPDITRLTITGLLHDIGKATVPVEILDKPGPLTEAEMTILRRHPVTGADYLKAFSNVAAPIRHTVRHHHELLDGSGYPDGLSGAEIDDLTRILTICDIYAALIERRSYKAAKTPEEAMAILEAMGSAGKVETDLVRALKRITMPMS